MSEAQEKQIRVANGWQSQILTRITSMAALAEWVKSAGGVAGQEAPAPPGAAALDEGISRHLNAARRIAQAGRRGGARRAAQVESALANLQAADELLLRRAPIDYVKGRLPDIHSDVCKYLDEHDPRRIRVETLVRFRASGDPPLTEEHRELVIVAVAAAHSHSRQVYAQARSFQSLILASAAALTLLALLLGLWGVRSPTDLALCFNPDQKIVCPTNETRFEAANPVPPGTDVDEVVSAQAGAGDIFLVEFVGLLAAAVSGSASLRKVSGTSTPYHLPLWLALIKLPTGALTAVLGLMLMRGGFVPGLTALDNSPQILAWAVIFGAGQQLVTGIVDRQAHSVLNNVSGKPHGESQRPAAE
ncbi:hypothetical protein [Pseudarthrobacter sp. MEB009]|uniref:hypothetical protein n=1 Tax=Pseudarthrobacter sp. MEB009 TaxID=3040326 RepID=UPI002556B0BB|nr:hypothetical protein [Pseudarthrobacter sp. MEB009]